MGEVLLVKEGIERGCGSLKFIFFLILDHIWVMAQCQLKSRQHFKLSHALCLL